MPPPISPPINDSMNETDQPSYATPADTDGQLDWRKVMKLSWRPAWSIRSRRGSIAPFLQMLREWLGTSRSG